MRRRDCVTASWISGQSAIDASSAIAAIGSTHLVRVIRNRRRAMRRGAGGMRSRALEPPSR